MSHGVVLSISVVGLGVGMQGSGRLFQQLGNMRGRCGLWSCSAHGIGPEGEATHG